MAHGAACDGDDGVDVGEASELDGVGTDGGGGAVDYEWEGFGCCLPGKREAEALVKAHGSCHACEGNGGCFCWRA